MADTPWLTIIGLGEDGPEGLPPASRKALLAADIVYGAKRHLSLLPELPAETIEWPVPFADGIPVLLSHRGRRVVMLASGDPFWFGAGTSVTKHLDPGEWQALPGPSSFGLAASRLGWGIEDTICLGLHAAPHTRLRPHITAHTRALATLRDGVAVGDLARWLTDLGFGASDLFVLEALGGPRERLRRSKAAGFELKDIDHPVIVGIAFTGPDDIAMPVAGGMPDDLFSHDGQITKRPMRALTLSALAPRAGELLWDIGAGSGSVGIEWLLAHPTNRAIAIEAHPERAARLRENADRLGVDRLQLVQAKAPDGLNGLPLPDAVFIGGGIDQQMLQALWDLLPEGTRLVANAVTLESEALLAGWQADKGGALLRIELSDAAPLGRKRGWKSAYPVVQWSVVR